MDKYKLDVSVADGKYRVILEESGRLKALRYDKEWRDCCGDKLIYCLAAELEEARNTIKEITNAVENYLTYK